MKAQPRDQIVLEGGRATHDFLLGGPGGIVACQGEATVEAFCAEFRRRTFGRDAWSIGPGPPGLVIRDVYLRNGFIVFLTELPPGLRTMQWVRADSPEPYGEGATYRDVHLALPWQYFFITMTVEGALASHHSVYFRNTPLQTSQDNLCDPHFYNCSVHAYGVWCWICAVSGFTQQRPQGKSFLDHVALFLEEFWYSGFNQSSEAHEPAHGGSFWSRNRKRIGDARIRTIEAWETASRADPNFAVTVPWSTSPREPWQVYEELTESPSTPPATIQDLANIMRACKQKGGV